MMMLIRTVLPCASQALGSLLGRGVDRLAVVLGSLPSTVKLQ